MPDYEARYEIRQAYYKDIDNIMAYIDDDWRKGHIMARDRRMFEYEFLEDDGSVNVVIAIDRGTQKIEGMIGYLYSSSDRTKRDVWGSIWKVRDGNMSLLGVEIMKRMETISKCRYNLGTGANPKTNIPLMRVMFGRTAAKMEHYYKLGNVPKDGYKIANVPDDYAQICLKKDDKNIKCVKRIHSADELTSLFSSDACINAIPYKDAWYIDKKFFKHPIYEYEVYGIQRADDDYIAAFVLRKQEACGHVCYRMVDFIGDFSAIALTKDFFDDILAGESCAEYVDFYCLGMNEEDMDKAGFDSVNDDIIIPNYFSPFVQQNIDIWVHYPVEGVTFVKADGDQDRPN